MISITKLNYAYPDGGFRLVVPALEIAQGESVALIGPSGTGKTTLLNLIAGVVSPQCGEIRVGELRVDAMNDAARRAFRVSALGMVFQNFELLEYLNVLDNILHPYRIHPVMRLDADVRERALALAHECGLGDKLLRYPDKLSQGERQRAAICRALINQPKIILADEPTGNLDPENKRRILQLLFAQAAQHGATLFVVTHDHGLLGEFDRVVDLETMLEPAQ